VSERREGLKTARGTSPQLLQRLPVGDQEPFLVAMELERTYNAAQQTEQIKRLGLLIGATQSDRDAQARHGIR